MLQTTSADQPLTVVLVHGAFAVDPAKARDVGPPDGQAVVLLHGWPNHIHSELLTVQLGVGFAASIEGQRQTGDWGRD